MRNKIVLLVSVLGFLTISLTAQEKDSTLVISGQGGGNSFISLNSVSLTAGYFEPSFGYLNSFFLPAARTSERFGGSLVYGANVSFDLPLNLGTRLGAWYFSDKVSGENGGSFNTFKISYTGLSLGAFYTYKKGIMGVNPYLGIDANYLMVQDKFDANDNLIKRSGNDLVWTPFIGISKVFNDKIVIGLEYGYVFGSYIQELQMDPNAAIKKYEIPMDGSKIQFTIGYKFP